MTFTNALQGLGIRIFLLVMAVTVFAGVFTYCFNHTGCPYQISYWQSYFGLGMIGCIRFVWDFERLV